MTAHQLARQLRHFNIRPKQFRAGEKTRGYDPKDFGDAFARYIPGFKPVHPVQPNGINDLGAESEPVQTEFCTGTEPVQTELYAECTGLKPVRTDLCTESKANLSDSKQRDVPDVPVQKPENGVAEGVVPDEPLQERISRLIQGVKDRLKPEAGKESDL